MDIILKQYTLPHPGIIWGARGHKKQIIPAGTEVWCIVYGPKIYGYAYLHKVDAEHCKEGLVNSTNGVGRRQMPLETLIAWNFKSTIPNRVSRPKLGV